MSHFGFWTQFWLNNGAAWYLTYMVYSTVIFGAVILVSRMRPLSPADENLLWRLSFLVVPFLVTARIVVEHLDASAIVTGPAGLTMMGGVGDTAMGSSIAFVIVALMLTGHLGRVAISERSRLASRRRITEGWIRAELDEIAAEAGWRPPILTACDHIGAPIAIGCREICIPPAVFESLSREQARAILVHELEHLRRRDTRWTMVASFLQRVFFLQPLHRMATRRLLETAEFAADESAVAHSGDPEHLILALTTFAHASRGGGVYGSGFAPGSLLLRRVERVLKGGSLVRFRTYAVPLILLLIGLIAWLSPAVVPACDCLL